MARKRKVYTSGTLYEKETGMYRTPGMDAMESKNVPISHKKKVGAGNATVTKGKKITGAVNGVGQETVDGFMDKNKKSVAKRAIKNRNNPPRRR